MDLKQDIEKLEQKIDNNMEKIINNMNRLHSCEEKITKNSERIKQNTGALEILHTINEVKKRFFTMWLLTFIILIVSICLNIFLLVK